jgi:glyoxylase-like metal-dependent hydrolase (beta-lactamase superfamily II)
MQKERISEDIYFFTSDLYAQVTASVVVGPEGAALIDTLAFPSETKQIKEYVEKRLGSRIRYVVNTHYHADHTNGNYLFPAADVIAHQACREKLDTIGREALAAAKPHYPELGEVEIRLPTVLVEDGPVYLHIGRKTLQLFHTPGHSADSISVLLKEDKILFAGDMMLPLPQFTDGDIDDQIRSLNLISPLNLENVVQGHGEIVLRGEIDDAVKSNLKYLDLLRKRVENLIKRERPRDEARTIELESCGKNRVALNGAVVQLHQANALSLYDRMASSTPNPKPKPKSKLRSKPAAKASGKPAKAKVAVRR